MSKIEKLKTKSKVDINEENGYAILNAPFSR